MANITVKNVITGEECLLSEVELNQLTIQDLILQLISGRVLNPESQLKPREDGLFAVYTLLDKNNATLDPDDLRKLAEIGYVDGDIVHIVTTSSRYIRPYVVVEEVLSGKRIAISCFLEQWTGRSLIEFLIDTEFLLRESQLPQNVGIPTLYRLVDKTGNLLEPFDTRTLEEIGYSRGDVVRVIYRSW